MYQPPVQPPVDRIETLATALAKRLGTEGARAWIKKQSRPYRELMLYYRCALMEVETKFRVLNEELSADSESNPIETIETRLKSPESILAKAERDGVDLAVESLEENIEDIAGIRIVCSFESDVYMLADALLRQDDVTLLLKKDYIANPKPSGYRSLHLIIATPIFLHDRTKVMRVEVQLRTLAMDVWASLEHKLTYKKDPARRTAEVNAKLAKCADISAQLDKLMGETRDLIGI